MEPHGYGVIADIQVLRDFGIVESRPVSQGEDLLVSLAKSLASVEQTLDPLLFDHSLLLGGDVGHEVRNPIQRYME